MPESVTAKPNEAEVVAVGPGGRTSEANKTPPPRNTTPCTHFAVPRTTKYKYTHAHAHELARRMFHPRARTRIPLDAQTRIRTRAHALTHTHLDTHSQGTLLPMSVTIGDTVLLPEYGGSLVKLGEDEFTLFREAELLGKLQ